MTPEEVRQKYRTGYNFQKETGLARNSLQQWVKKGYVPELSQQKLELITNGELKSEWTKRIIEELSK